MADTGPSFHVFGPNDLVDGTTIAQWTQDWWTWLWQDPSSKNPTTDQTGGYANVHNNGSVFFIAGGPDGNFERTFNVPAGKLLLIPMINAIDTEDPQKTETKFTSDFLKSVTSDFATIDGVKLQPYTETTGFFDMGATVARTVAADFFGAPVGSQLSPSKASGYWLMVGGLSRGTHDLQFGGSSSGTNLTAPFSVTVHDIINVV
jgi:hypothetical protein